MSRIGKQPVPVPSGVDVTINGRNVSVKGPKGTLTLDVAEPITVDRDVWYGRGGIDRLGLALVSSRFRFRPGST